MGSLVSGFGGSVPFIERNYIQDISIKLARLRHPLPWCRRAFREETELFIFAQIRSHLEHQNRLGDFPYIHFFANWMVHPQLTQVTMGARIAQKIVEVLGNNNIPLERKTVEINVRLGSENLRNELKTLFRECNL